MPGMNEACEGNTNVSVSTFVLRLVAILNSDLFPGVCSFNQIGDGFLIFDVKAFASHVLPYFTKSSSFMSFVRQLNHYEFRKTRSGATGFLGKNVVEFKHSIFHRDRPHLYHLVVRKQWSPLCGRRGRSEVQQQLLSQNISTSSGSVVRSLTHLFLQTFSCFVSHIFFTGWCGANPQ
jgi:hypothetical protein